MTTSFISPSGVGFSPADVDDFDDEEQHYASISFDPGGITGWSVFVVHPDAIDSEDYNIMDNIIFWSAGQFTGESQDRQDDPEDVMAIQMLDLSRAWPRAKVVCEDFVLRKFSSGRELLSPVRVTAKFALGLRMYFPNPRRAIIKQQPSLAMSTITDDRLRRMGLYTPLSGQEHARDAVKHNLTWLKRAKQMAVQAKITASLMNGHKG